MCGGQVPFCKMILVFVGGLIVSRAKLSLELLALRQQPVVLRRSVQRPQIQNRVRRLWIVVGRVWKDWRQALVIVKPETVEIGLLTAAYLLSPGDDLRWARSEARTANFSQMAIIVF